MSWPTNAISLVILLLASCAPAPVPAGSASAVPSPAVAKPSPVPAAAGNSPSVAANGSLATPTLPKTAEADYTATVAPVTAAQLPFSWRPGCPVAPEDLRLLSVSHIDFNGAIRQGELVVHRMHADDIVSVMRALFQARYPIERMEPVDHYQGDDDLSVAANNSSAFNCRAVTGRAGVWSQHAYGWALDINPVQNPYVSAGKVLPPAGQEFVDRSQERPGMIRPGDVVVEAFSSIGWKWGGTWLSVKDYQHFSLTGR
ncbi:MAG: M15 family metallopeptidase [Actinomycetota bacterium]